MKLDKLDFESLDALHEGGQDRKHTTSEVAKRVFSDEEDVRLSNLDSRVRARLNKLSNYGIVVKQDDTSPNKYNINYQDVVYGRTEMSVDDDLGEGGKTYQLDAEKVLFISNDEGLTIRGFIPMDEGGLDRYTAEQASSSKLNDPEWLRTQYVEQGRGLQQIAETLNVKAYRVKRWLNHFGIAKDQVAAKLQDEVWLREKHVKEELTPVEIANLLDINYVTVRNYMVLHGIEVRYSNDDRWKHSDLRKRLIELGLWNGKCWKCGEEKSNLQVQRILPAYEGGDDHADNLAVICDECYGESVGDGDVPKLSKDEASDILENHPLYS